MRSSIAPTARHHCRVFTVLIRDVVALGPGRPALACLFEICTLGRPSGPARTLDAPEPTVSREVRRLLDAGLLTGHRVGRAVVLSSAPGNPASEPPRQLLLVTHGPSRRLEGALTGVAGIEEAYVRGSWADRYHGKPGAPPGDMDVIVVGHPDRAEIDAAVEDFDTYLAGGQHHLPQPRPLARHRRPVRQHRAGETTGPPAADHDHRRLR